MELTVKRSGMPCCENVFAYLMPAEEAVETVVPDTMPDVERILFTEGIASIRSKEVLDGAREHHRQRERNCALCA